MVASSRMLMAYSQDSMPAGYGYVVLVGIGGALVDVWLGTQVMKARKEHDVQYPTMYSPDNNQFNCIQRAHQNTLENYPHFLMLLFLGGLQYPRISAGAGCVYLCGRLAFAKGYYTGDPANRRWGSFGYIGMLTLLGNTISFACHQLRWV